MKTAKVALEKVSKPGAKETMFLVKVDGNPVGLITKYKNTKTETHPWKAWAGVGRDCKFIDHQGTKQDAINAVLEAV